MQIASEDLICLGLWGDGVLMSRNREQSLELLSFNILTHPSRHDMRIPIFAMQKHWLQKETTYDEVMKVISWSLVHAAAGRNPITRHDGTPFSTKDAWRLRRAGERIPRAVLLELRADWAFLKQTLYLPQWCLGVITQ
jgi:hypothetical protein